MERVGGLSIETVPSIGWWSGDNPLIYRFIYGSCWLGEMRWGPGLVKAKTFVRPWEKSRQCFSNCSKRACFICTVQPHRAFWIYGNSFFFLKLLVGFYFFFPFKLGRCSLSWLVENGLLAENKAWKQQFTRLSAGFQINTNLWPPCFGSSRPKYNKMKQYTSLLLL